MSAWVVRAGQRGENEHWDIEHGRVSVGWPEVGDLSPATSREDVRRRVEEAYPGDGAARWANYTGQLWAFRDSIRPGDLVILPLKTKPGYVQFGRVIGAYAHDAAEAGWHRSHSLPVDWLGEPVSKTVVGQDLVHTLNGSLTVFQPSRNDAERRLEAIARGKPDPGFTEGLPRPVATPADHATTEVTDPETAPTVVAIRDRIRAHVAGEFREHELTHLVAEILTVLGFRCEVSPPGPDGGVDIIAGTGPLGLDAPTLIVEVKSEPTPIGSRVLRGLHSAMTQHRADQALLVAWGGVTRPAETEFKRDRTTMRIWDADALLDQLFLTYDRLPASTRARIPLQQVWVLEDEG